MAEHKQVEAACRAREAALVEADAEHQRAAVARMEEEHAAREAAVIPNPET